MPPYEILRTTRCQERHTIDARDPGEALRLFEEGCATLKGDEVIAVDDVIVMERDTERNVTAEAEASLVRKA